MAFSIIACVASAPWVWFTANGAGFDYYQYLQTDNLQEVIDSSNNSSSYCTISKLVVY